MKREEKWQGIPLKSSRYPLLLKKISHPPRVLYFKGEEAILKGTSVAIVGTRKASGEGREFARQIAHELAAAGLVIVSGLAQGIDGAAHQGALDAKGKTIGVLGSSLEDHFFFPQQHRRLAKEMLAGGGAILSEHEKNQPALRRNFVARNRIVAGLSVGTLVVEAPMKSGALITAGFAKKANRLVFAVPGSPFSKNFEGTNWLIKNGALLVQNAKDILDILKKRNLFKLQKNKKKKEEGGEVYSNEEENVREVLQEGPCHIDELTKKTNVEVSRLLALLIELEMRGIIKHAGGGTYLLIRR